MKLQNIKEAKKEAIRFLDRLESLEKRIKEESKNNWFRLEDGCKQEKETGALKRSSLDLTMSLSKMRNDKN